MTETIVTLDNLTTFLSNFKCEDESSYLYGLVDMGSNGIRFSISNLSPPFTRLLTCLYHERAPISLYDALHESKSDSNSFYFPDYIIVKVAETLGRFRRICAAYGIPNDQFIVFATEAFRTAKNNSKMSDAILATSGATVKILSPAVETLFGAMGARSGFSQVDGLLMDLGGGSLQITYVNSSMGDNYETLAAKAAQSLPFGAARLTAIMNDPNAAKDALAQLQAQMKSTIQRLVSYFPQLRTHIQSTDGVVIYFSGGGFRGYGSMLMHKDPIQLYPIPTVGGYSVSGSRFGKWHDMLMANQNNEKIFGLSKRRRHQFPAIAMVVKAIVLAIPKIKSVTFCTGGNREGVLFMKLPPSTREIDPFSLIPVPVPDLDADVISSVTNLLIAAFPTTYFLPPSIFTQRLLSFISHHIWAYQGLTGNSSRILHSVISTARTALPSIPHDLCAILALTLSARWGFDLGPMDSLFAKNLQKMLSIEMIWWCRYVGTACHFLSVVFPVFPKDVESIGRAIQWKAVSSRTLGKNNNKEGIVLYVNLLQSLEKGIPGGSNGHWLKMWKKFGKGLNIKRKLKIDIRFMENESQQLPA